MNCSSCGTENDAGRKFCGECGAPLARTCRSCGAANPGSVKFCGECGSSLAGDESVDIGARVGETERRLVSVLFIDLVGFTTVAEQRDPEDTRALLTAYFDTARTVIERHGGVVEKFIGDAVMAVWGTPVAYEDDAERAVRAALELVDAVEAMSAVEGLELEARAGVLTGEAATRPGATSQGMVAGDMVNTAARLQSAAEPGTVLVGESTAHAAGRTIAFQQVGDLELKGKNEPVPAYRALRVIAERGAATDLVEPPFVGRVEELRLLKDHLHATSRDGKARVVSITGIGGIGKSRLIGELGKYVDGLTEDFYWHSGRCPSYGDGVTFWALGEMVRMRADIAEGDDPALARTKLARCVEDYVTDPEDRAWIETHLRFLLGIGERPASSGEETFAPWRHFFESIASRGPVVMVFEDLQWADQGLLDFIGSLLEWSRDHPILVVTLSRPEIVDRRPDWGRGQRAFTSVHLAPLPDEAIAEMVVGLVPTAPEEVTALIVSRSEGVPLYAVETIRMLADRGYLRSGDLAYELVGPIEDLEVPETLQALIASRLDALEPADRSLMQDAAVLGKSFTMVSLGRISGHDRDTLEPRLRELVRREFLVIDVDPRSPERGNYGFTQSLIREVAYGTLSKADRRSKHLKAAAVFEAIGDEELASVVAAHYGQALAESPPGEDSTELAATTRHWLGRAAARASSLGSPGQALGYLDRAMEITGDSLERLELVELAAKTAEDAARKSEWVAYLRDASELAATLGRDVDEARIRSELIRALWDSDDDAETHKATEILRGRFAESEDIAVRAYVAFGSRYLRFMDQNFEAALHEAEVALSGLAAIGDHENLLRAIVTKTYTLLTQGRTQEAAMVAMGYVDWARRHGSLRQLVDGLETAAAAINADDPRGGYELETEAMGLARRAGLGTSELNSLLNGVEAAVEIGDWAGGEAMLERLDEIGDLASADLDMVKLNRALLAAYRGDGVEAGDLLGQIENLNAFRTLTWLPRVQAVVLTQGGDPEAGFETAFEAATDKSAGHADPNTPYAVWTAGRAALWTTDQLPAALPRLKDLLEAATYLNGTWIDNVRSCFEAAIAGLEGRRDDAVAGFTSALRTWSSIRLPFDHAQTVGDAVVVLGRDALPAEEVEAAIDFLEGLGARPLLGRITGES